MAYYLKEDLRQIWMQPNKRTARRVLRDWLARARASGVRMLEQFADTLEATRKASWPTTTTRSRPALWRGPTPRSRP